MLGSESGLREEVGEAVTHALRPGESTGRCIEPPRGTATRMGAKSMRYESDILEVNTPELTVLVRDSASEAAVPKSDQIRVLRPPQYRTAERARNVFVIVPAIHLPDVATVVSRINRRNQLRALFIREEKNTSWLPQLLERAGLKTLKNTVVYSNDVLPRRVLSAWSCGAQDDLIADATVADDRLFVISCTLERFEVPFEKIGALRCIPVSARGQFIVQQDGAYIHWPQADVHLDLDAIRVAINPTARKRAARVKARHDQLYGRAIARVRQKYGLKQSDIEGLSERQVRRIEKGEGTTVRALERLARAHGKALQDYLAEVAHMVSSASIEPS